MAIDIRRLRPTDDRFRFSCGDIELDRFFHRYAGQNQFKHYVGTTYVAVEGDKILGFVTVAASQLEIEGLPKTKQRRLPAYPLPVLRLARLGVQRSAQGSGVGLLLLKAVLVLARRMSHAFGCVGVVVDAKPDAIPFYLKYGFFALTVIKGGLGDRPQPTTLFLELDAIPNTDDEPPRD